MCTALQWFERESSYPRKTLRVTYCLDPCEIISTWLGYEYETTAVDSDNASTAIVYECGDGAKFADESRRKYASCDVNGYWDPEIEECQGR